MVSILILMIAGLVAVVLGSDFLVDGASAIARRLKVSEFVIGLTIVGFGTSCPELVVSLTGALHGSADVSVGNVIGSNAFNTLLILGITALISPLVITASNRKRDIPIMMIVTFFFLLIAPKGVLNLIDGIVLLLLFAVYMVICFKSDEGDSSEEDPKEMKIVPAILLTIVGLAGLILGGDLFVDNAIELAHRLGVSEKFIAITLLAGGTSLPELATCVMAAVKGKGQLALGNILGSNVFNILLILGCAAVVTPISTASMGVVDYAVLAASALLLFICASTGQKNKVGRAGGAMLLLCEIAYLIWLTIQL